MLYINEKQIEGNIIPFPPSGINEMFIDVKIT